MNEFMVQLRWYLDMHSKLRLDEIDELIANRVNNPHIIALHNHRQGTKSRWMIEETDGRKRRLITDEPLSFEQLMEGVSA